MTWERAHMVAFTAAPRAHARFGVDDRDRVDVFAALQRAGFDVFGQPMPQLFGMYLADDGRNGPAALVNSRMPETVIRHTAAHELGHHVLGHASQVDYDLNALHTGKRPWTKEEQEAEAFAAWFLMPRKAIAAMLARTGHDAVSTPRAVYQLALWLSVSYAGVLRQAQNIKILSKARAGAWSDITSGRPDPGPWPSAPRRVWELGPAADGGQIHVQTGDRLRIAAAGDGAGLELPDGLQILGRAGGAVDVDVTTGFTTPGGLTAGNWSIGITPTPLRVGNAQAWPKWAGGNHDDEAEEQVR